ncbi:MAG: response regulator [Planctomycetota bacterium]|nr:response regulator [Planctomycetota bacterium]
MTRILVVDDDEIAREMLKNALSRAGYEVETASDGCQALRILRQDRCRLVITDWEMPHMTGIELCHAIRAGDFPGYVYVILLTGRDSLQETVDGMSAGADDFIKKPFDPSELVVRVRAGERVLSLETREVAIFALARLAESRDPETGAHLDRVRSYCRVIGSNLLLNPKFSKEVDGEFVRLLYSTSPLHDIGKVGIPDNVLLKPGLLSDSEYAVMKSHAQLGADTLQAALAQFPQAKFLKMARDIAATHHERYDGTGYPAGLAGDDIPLCGRIVALADVYDALTSKRVYKPAYCHDVAKSIIVDGTGKHFDPDIVKAFLACEEQFVEICQRLHQSARNNDSADEAQQESRGVLADSLA